MESLIADVGDFISANQFWAGPILGLIVFGESHPVELLAAVLGTIPYEIFTSISGRVKRVYFFE